MAEENVVGITSVDDNTNSNLKRKLNDLDESPSAADVANPDSSAADDNVDDDPSKRPRLDDQANGNGHKPEEENGHAEENAAPEADEENATPEADEENATPEVDLEDAETADGDESTKEAVDVKDNEAEPAPEVEQKIDAENENSGKTDDENLTSGEVQKENIEKIPGNEADKSVSEVAAGDVASAGKQSDSGSNSISKKIEIPNNKVGVLIGKAGETIRYLQINSGAKIQITRDADADPRAATRAVEIIGTSESLNKAEMLIRDVIAEADAGGSPALVARGFQAAMTAGFSEVEIPVPGDKVGLIIGRGGETIKNLQTRSGARIQLIPQNVPGEQQSKEKKVKITGDKKQIEVARELIKEVMNQMPGRPSHLSGSNHNQQGYLPRGPSGASHWGNNRGFPNQPMPYDYHQRGPHPSQNQQYPGQSYGNYPYQGPPRGNSGSGWEHRPPSQGPPSGGYDYYGQGGGPPRPGHASGPSMAPPPHSQGSYNYGPPRGPGYAQQAPYSQTTPPAQNYGHGYGDPKYDAQAPVQQQPPYGSQGYAPPQQGYAPPQQGYAPQQQYSRPPPYGTPSQGAPQGGYAPPTASQPTDTPYQAPVPGSTPHQQYPYAPGPTAAQAPYGSAPVANDAYSQPQQTVGYSQPGAQAQPAPVYGQPGAQAQPAPAYGQPGAQAQPAPAYGQPGVQAQPAPAYGQQAGGYAQAAAQTGYGYQQQADPSAYAYQQADPSVYAAAGAYSAAPAPAAQAGYGQPVAAQPGYDQSTGAYTTPAAAAPR